MFRTLSKTVGSSSRRITSVSFGSRSTNVKNFATGKDPKTQEPQAKGKTSGFQPTQQAAKQDVSGTSVPSGSPARPATTTATSMAHPGQKTGSADQRVDFKTASGRYAQALLQVAQQNKEVDAIERDMKYIISAIEDPRLGAIGIIFTDRSLTAKERMRMMEPLLKVFKPTTQQLIRVCIERFRALTVPRIAEAFLEQLKEARKEYTATVTTPTAITADERQKYINLAKEKLNKGSDVKVTLIEKIDTNLESGFILTLPNLYVNRARVREDKKKQQMLNQALNSLVSSAQKELEGPQLTYDQWLFKWRDARADDLIQELEK